MYKLNEAVESMKRERRLSGGVGEEELVEGGGGGVEEQKVKKEEEEQTETESTRTNAERKKTRAASATATAGGRPRSRSVDGVTFASSPLRPLETLMEHGPLNMFDEDEDDTTKRPLEGILKEPSSNKRSR